MDELISQIEHKDIVGSVQTNRKGLGAGAFKPFCASNATEKRKAVVNEMRTNEDEARQVHLVQCSLQGQCLQWESVVVEGKISWKDSQDLIPDKIHLQCPAITSKPDTLEAE